MEYRVLPWTADHQAIKTWLIDQGYGNCADKLSPQIKVGQTLYAMDRETLREMFGAADGVRLYSQLQKDKPKSEKAAGVVKETDFQVDIGSKPFVCKNQHGFPDMYNRLWTQYNKYCEVYRQD